MKDYIILGLDLSLSCTGWNILTPPSNILDYGKIETKKKDYEDDIKRLEYICNKIEDILNKYEVSRVVIEDTIPVKNSRSVLQANFLKGMVLKTMIDRKIHISLLYPSTTKKLVTGNGRATKEEVATTIQDTVINIGQYSDSKKNKTSDIYDSIALSIAFLKGVE
ncbi:MAG: crossover junction endodeoxyribonuclease RuvC [Peptostreptococcaceae bacterium]